MTKREARRSRKQETAAILNDVSAREEHQMSKGELGRKTIQIAPKTENQKRFIDGIKYNEVSVGIGPAGVGKTFVAASMAASMLQNHEIETIVLTRANQTVGKSIGMLPGDIDEKMTPLLLPILNVLKRQLGDAVYEYCLRKKKIQMLPFEYVRGMSFFDSFVLVDEAQNLDEDGVIALCTRYESGRIVLMGDPFQHDLDGEPGIEWLRKFGARNNIDMPVTEFNLDDIVRSKFVKDFLVALYAEKAKRKAK